jgi:hypothetical protein
MEIPPSFSPMVLLRFAPHARASEFASAQLTNGKEVDATAWRHRNVAAWTQSDTGGRLHGTTHSVETCEMRTLISFSTISLGKGSSIAKCRAPFDMVYESNSPRSSGNTEPLCGR